MIGASSTHEEILRAAKFVSEAEARLKMAASLASNYDQGAVLSSLANRFGRLQGAVCMLAQAFEIGAASQGRTDRAEGGSY